MKRVSALFSRVASYLKRSATEASLWFRAGNWFWLALAIAILFVFYVTPGQLHDRVRWADTFFEFLGICVVVIGIDRARRSFSRPSVLQGMGIWIGEFRFIFFRRPPINVSANPLASVANLFGAAAVVSSPAPKSMEERVAQLENQVTVLQTNLGTLDRKFDQQKKELQVELNKEASARQAGDQNVSKKLEESMIGDSSFELAGAVYVSVGLVMAHLSEEIALCLGFLGLT